MKNSCTNKLKQSSSEINAELNRLDTIIQDIFKEYELQGTMPSIEDVKALFNTRIALKEEEETQEKIAVPQKSFWKIYDEFTKECGRLNDWTPATFGKFNALKEPPLNV